MSTHKRKQETSSTGAGRATRTLALLAATAAIAVGCASRVAPPAPAPAPAPVVDGRCGDELGVCLLGTPVLPDEGSEVLGWQCLGLNGGANAACTLPRPDLPQPAPAAGGATQPSMASTVGGAQRGATQPPASQPRARGQIRDLLAAKAQRTPAQRKVGSRLLERAVAEALRGSGQPLRQGLELAADGVPEQRQAEDGRVLVDIRADVTPAVLASIRELGGAVVNSVPKYRAIRALLPLPSVERLAALDAIQAIRTADETVTRKDDTSEGDVAHAASRARGPHGVDGSGIGIGVLSNGVRTLADRQRSGDVPAQVTVLPGQEGVGDEGTALLEIVHDLAPGAELYFATVSRADQN